MFFFVYNSMFCWFVDEFCNEEFKGYIFFEWIDFVCVFNYWF